MGAPLRILSTENRQDDRRYQRRRHHEGAGDQFFHHHHPQGTATATQPHGVVRAQDGGGAQHPQRDEWAWLDDVLPVHAKSAYDAAERTAHNGTAAVAVAVAAPASLVAGGRSAGLPSHSSRGQLVNSAGPNALTPRPSSYSTTSEEGAVNFSTLAAGRSWCSETSDDAATSTSSSASLQHLGRHMQQHKPSASELEDSEGCSMGESGNDDDWGWYVENDIDRPGSGTI